MSDSNESSSWSFLDVPMVHSFLDSLDLNSFDLTIDNAICPSYAAENSTSSDEELRLSKSETDEENLRTPSRNQSRKTAQSSTTSGYHSFDLAEEEIIHMDDFIVGRHVTPQKPKNRSIEIIAQPRSNFRPRTITESRISSHFLRTDDESRFKYPRIKVASQWQEHSDINFIEVALVDIRKQRHPYILHNKSQKTTWNENVAIFQQGDTNVLYFRLDQTDFTKGYKEFQIELIKLKQDEGITKERIRSHRLYQSMLRFTRIFGDGKAHLLRDSESVVYSNIMTESFGNFVVHDVGPRFGPMNCSTNVFILLKGRSTKGDLKVTLTDRRTKKEHQVRNLTVNGNTAHFTISPLPDEKEGAVTIDIDVYFQDNLVHRSPYRYLKYLDQEMAALSTDAPANLAETLPQMAHVSASYQNRSSSKSGPLKRIGQRTAKH